MAHTLKGRRNEVSVYIIAMSDLDKTKSNKKTSIIGRFHPLCQPTDLMESMNSCEYNLKTWISRVLRSTYRWDEMDGIDKRQMDETRQDR